MKYIALLFVLILPFNAMSASKSFTDIIQETKKSVVLIKVKKETTKKDTLFEEYLKEKQDTTKDDKKPIYGAGTGFFIENNTIITNYHVVEDSTNITVTFENDIKEYKTSIIAYDKLTDIALIKIDDEFNRKIKPLKWAVSQVVPGEDVWAIGHPYGLTFSISKGIVSHSKRRLSSPWQTNIQSDVSINTGNSGGPLLNMKGEVVGINTLILTPNTGSIGVSISVDAMTAQFVVKHLKENKKISRPYIGIKMIPSESHVKISKVLENSPAEKAGLKDEDLLLKIDSKSIVVIDDLFDVLLSKEIGDKITLTVKRGDHTLKFDLILNTINN